MLNSSITHLPTVALQQGGNDLCDQIIKIILGGDTAVINLRAPYFHPVKKEIQWISFFMQFI